MGQKYVKYTLEFRVRALGRLELTPNVAQLCRGVGISRQLLFSWRESKQGDREQAAAGPRFGSETRSIGMAAFPSVFRAMRKSL